MGADTRRASVANKEAKFSLTTLLEEEAMYTRKPRWVAFFFVAILVWSGILLFWWLR